MKKLSPKQQDFVDYYLECGNAAEAYMKAYKSVKKETVARANASRLLTNANVRKNIDIRMEQLQSERVASQQEVMEYLSSVMRREHKEVVVVTLTKEVSKWVDGKKQTVKEEIPELVEIPAKLSDANKAAELLGKRYAMWTDKQQVDVTGAVTFVDDIGDGNET